MASTHANRNPNRRRHAACLFISGLTATGCATLRGPAIVPPESAIASPVESAASPVMEPTTIQPIAFHQASETASPSDVLLTEPYPPMPLAIEGISPTYDLATLEQLALGNNASIATAGALARKASGLRAQIGAAPNPDLGYFGQQLADRNTEQNGIFVQQEFVRGNKLQLNRDVLAHTTNAQRWELETQRTRVLTDVRVRYFAALAAQQTVFAIEEFQTLAERGVQIAEDRRRAAEGSLIEVLQSQTLLSETRLAREQTEVAYRGAWQDLAAIAGLSITTPPTLAGDLEVTPTPQDWDAVYQTMLTQSPELSTARAIVCEKSALVRRQEVQMVPNVVGQLGAGYDRSTDSGMINVQVSSTLPIWNRNSGNISAAFAEYTRAAQNVERIEQSIQSRLAVAARDYDSALAAVRKYEDEIVPQATKSLELSEQAYGAGELDFLQVLIVRQTYYESKVRLIAAQGELAQAAALIDGLVLTGGLEAPQDYTDGTTIRDQTFSGQ